MATKDIDYSLYLVTGRDLLPPGKDYLETLEEAIRGGVNVVQVREKTADTGEFLRIAQATSEICKRHSIPLVINDRIDIALAVGAGVHLGQDDMPVEMARKLLPPGTIIGLSCNTLEHAQKAVADGHVDYVGIGPIYETATKKRARELTLGPRKAAKIVEVLQGTNIKSVAIGGIKSLNALRVLSGVVSPGHHALDGIAVVSEIMASPEPRQAAEMLADRVRTFKNARQALPIPGSLAVRRQSEYTPEAVIEQSGVLLEAVRKYSPLVHQITNNVVINQSANATLALGASPIMATAPEEMEDLSKIPGGLLVNFGTITNKEGMFLAGLYANVNKKPVVFDPVGVGATAFRRSSAEELLDRWQPTVIKGNAAEIGALVGSTDVASKGVDSAGPGFADPIAVVKRLALQERCIVVLTGKTDYATDGNTVVQLSNGHPLLAEITGSGCMVGTAVATFCAAASLTAQAEDEHRDGRLYSGDMLAAACAAVLVVTIASELAGEQPDVKGPGTFLPALIDQLSMLTADKIKERAHVAIARNSA